MKNRVPVMLNGFRKRFTRLILIHIGLHQTNNINYEQLDSLNKESSDMFPDLRRCETRKNLILFYPMWITVKLEWRNLKLRIKKGAKDLGKMGKNRIKTRLVYPNQKKIQNFRILSYFLVLHPATNLVKQYWASIFTIAHVISLYYIAWFHCKYVCDKVFISEPGKKHWLKKDF